MKPNEIPEWAMKEAEELAPDVSDDEWGIRPVEPIARALAAAYQRGREEAAVIVNGWHISKGGYTELAASIRALK